MRVPPEIGYCALLAFGVMFVMLCAALRQSPRTLIPDHVHMEVVDPQTLRLYCRNCTKSAAIIMPTRCEGAMLVAEIFAGQHANCPAQPVTFV